MRDLHNNMLASNALDIAAITTNTTTVGDIIDLRGYDTCEFVIQSGTLTDGAYVAVLEVGDDSGLSDAAAAASTELLGSLPSFALTDDNTVKRVGLVTGKRYARLSITSTAVTTGGTLGATCVQGNPADAPVA